MLPARMRSTVGWSDACILNLSSRGLMVHANFSALEAGVVELWHGDHAITARVVWREGPRAGLRAEERIPVEEILSGNGSSSVVSAESYRGVERRKRPRNHDRSRLTARIFEFASVVAIAATLAVGFCLWVEAALAGPLGAVQAVLHD